MAALHFQAFYGPEDLASGSPARHLAIANANGLFDDEGWRMRANGTRFWAHVAISALREPDGTLRGYGQITHDLGERHAGELALRASEERFRCFFDEARTPMMIVDLEGRYERVNDAFCALVGYSHEELAATVRTNITHPDDFQSDAAIAAALLRGDVPSALHEKRYIHSSGRTVLVSINVTMSRGPDGKPTHFMAQALDITENRIKERQLAYMADHDPLTGLLNRRAFQRELADHLARVAGSGATGALLILDIDNFKYYNDSRGHSAGDELIVRIAEALKSRLRESDVIARIGGDEFAALLPRADEAAALTVARALLDVVRGLAIPAINGQNKWITSSAGIALFSDSERPTADDMIVSADLAMYDAKEAGGDRWSRYRTEQRNRPQIESRILLAEQIGEALARDSFELHAQPIVDLATGVPTQYELLIRMRDGHGNVIAPGSFLPVAEHLGLIVEIDRWVTRRAIDILAEQRARGRDLRFEINLSGLTIGDEVLLELVKRRLCETGVPPDRLIFEVTETAAIEQFGRAVAFVERLTELGCRFALDDFGAGFGSFYYLKHLEFDYLKIDGEFVQHCARNETDRVLIAAVVQIAHGMGKRTVAEFVTSSETADVLTKLGVDYGQGFHFGKPAPLAQHLSLLDAAAR
jgi:diguanylate cyclase (GGDEF)-like protein/PAS domain S-box-containing protein